VRVSGLYILVKLPHVGGDRGNGGRSLILVMVVVVVMVVVMVMESRCGLQNFIWVHLVI
jgi:uncharacterized protein (DUF983 family)